jgi:hypothetical protein
MTLTALRFGVMLVKDRSIFPDGFPQGLYIYRREDIEAWIDEQYNPDNRPHIPRHNSSRRNEPIPPCELITGNRARTGTDLKGTGSWQLRVRGRQGAQYMSANERTSAWPLQTMAPFLAASYGLKTLARLATDPGLDGLSLVPIDGPGRRRSGFLPEPVDDGLSSAPAPAEDPHITSDEDRIALWLKCGLNLFNSPAHRCWLP